MKKIICMLLLAANLLTAISLSSCANNGSGDNAENTQNTENTDKTNNGTNSSTTAPSGGEESPASPSLQEIADSIQSTDYEYPSLMSVEVGADTFEYFFGIAKPDGVKEALAVEPAMTSVPFSLCLIRVEEGTDTAKLASTIKEKVDPAKWVCVTASYVETAVNGDLIILVMDGDNARGKALVDAFKAI